MRCVCAWIFKKLVLLILNYLMNLSFNFQKEIFAKQNWRLFNPSFSLYFAYFLNLIIEAPYFNMFYHLLAKHIDDKNNKNKAKKGLDKLGLSWAKLKLS